MKKMIGIIVAQNEEFEAIEDIMVDTEIEEVRDLRILVGKIGDNQCALVKSGIGKVNAARTTQIILDYFDIKYFINVGAAGSVNSMLNIGDVIVGKRVVQHDFDITAFGHSKGYITGVGNSIECDRNLVDEFEQVIRSTAEKSYNIKLGVVATGDIFCTEISMKDKIRSKFDADVTDMECGAIAQVCYLENMPFIVIRTVCNTPRGRSMLEYDANLKLAARRCGNILREFLI